MISDQGIRPISSALDHVGPLAKTVDDMAIVLESLTGNVYSNDLEHPMAGLRVGVPKQYFFDCVHPSVNAAYQKALANLEALGATLIEVDVPVVETDIGVMFSLAISEGATVHEQRLKTSRNQFGADVLNALSAVETISPVDYIKALQRQTELTHQFDRFFEYVDVLATPAASFPSQPIGVNEVEMNGELHDYFAVTTHAAAPFNLSGHPAISIPCGHVVEHNMPLGLPKCAESLVV